MTRQTYRMEDRVMENIEMGKNCTIWYFVNMYNSTLGENISVGALTEIQEAEIGDNTRIGAQCFICDGVYIGKNCFIGPKVCFTNDLHPSVEKALSEDFEPLITVVEDNVVIGANSTILPGVTICKGAVIGAGSIVTKDVPENAIWIGDKLKKLK